MKNRKILQFLLCVGILIGIFINPMTCKAQNLDEIREYQITVSLECDGSFMMHYYIEWEVLDSTADGPLTWVKIGIPNKNVEEITAYSDSIDDIYYYDKGGEYVRIDLDRAYEAGEVVTMEFSIHQHRMYYFDAVSYPFEDGSYVCDFTPGWFDDIDVDHMQINWEAQEHMEVFADTDPEKRDGSYVMETALGEGQRYDMTAYYDGAFYNFSDEYSVTNPWEDIIKSYLFIFLILGAAVFFVVMLIKEHKKPGRDSYTASCGMARYYEYRNRSISSSHGGGGCACACACACAGGGRAGCSKKDFYGTKLETMGIKKALLKHKK